MKIGIFLTGQHPPGSDVLAELEGQYAMTRLARDKGWDAVATGQHYLSEGVRQLQLVPSRPRSSRRCSASAIARVFQRHPRYSQQRFRAENQKVLREAAIVAR
jgi:hypothetical protein